MRVRKKNEWGETIKHVHSHMIRLRAINIGKPNEQKTMVAGIFSFAI